MVMGFSNIKKNEPQVGFAAAFGGRSSGRALSPAEKKLMEQIADQLLQEHAETLKKLGDE